jgi:hypothetical protein
MPPRPIDARGPSTQVVPSGQPSALSRQLSTHNLVSIMLPRAALIVAQLGVMLPLLGFSLQSLSIAQLFVHTEGRPPALL